MREIVEVFGQLGTRVFVIWFLRQKFIDILNTDCVDLSIGLLRIPLKSVRVDNLPIARRVRGFLRGCAGTKRERDILDRALVALKTFLRTVGAKMNTTIFKIEFHAVEVHPGSAKDNCCGAEAGNKEFRSFEVVLSGSDGDVDFVGNMRGSRGCLFAVKGFKATRCFEGDKGEAVGLRKIEVYEISCSKGIGNGEGFDGFIESNWDYNWSRVFWSISILSRFRRVI